ncbi:ComF family protein [Qipengyuania sediminis]|uniref:ComF family protein n=1 Tax=Qipengyuania sediminis TaxID=1532023 RepID=UPI001059F5B4|nr:ComF family protein [Qipengyuania sediminis]
MTQALDLVLDFVFPPRCLACGAAVGKQGGLCGECWAGLAIPGEPCCAACQRPLTGPAEGGEALCAPCLAVPPRHAGIHAATLYTPVSRKLILAFKHGRRIALAPTLARLIAARLPAGLTGQVIVPVPLHRWRLWGRGYNQAALLAHELARMGHGTLAVDALVRVRRTPSLGGLGKKARRKALRGAIRVAQGRQSVVRGREVLLVDDVLTSGATTDACAAALRRAGARSVRIACFARVLEEAIPLTTNRTPGAAMAPGAG